MTQLISREDKLNGYLHLFIYAVLLAFQMHENAESFSMSKIYSAKYRRWNSEKEIACRFE